ncbi:hypothetical protein BDDG_08411 [Blastomyces dermatitidis ATCC 18188]|uniref:Uncharacterized protein n=1 Tax=Ajellomyces dermatitidis (strain ATCC 18188 / CBS 674.68) TaxID=653446 RepID=F2TQF3_AJEDA|nr:hypothetical protein BDDG_08411 [Blastomyces dermatitidis ATCC 18188]
MSCVSVVDAPSSFMSRVFILSMGFERVRAQPHLSTGAATPPVDARVQFPNGIMFGLLRMRQLPEPLAHVGQRGILWESVLSLASLRSHVHDPGTATLQRGNYCLLLNPTYHPDNFAKTIANFPKVFPSCPVWSTSWDR